MTSGKGEAPFASAARSRRARAWLRALRPHQWAKNLLVFVPVLLAGPLGGRADLARAALGFAVLSLLSAAGYVVNDLLDVEADRRHRAKRLRPFAAGELAVAEGVPGAALLALAAAGLAALMPPAFVPVAAVYLAGTLAYSLALKREPCSTSWRWPACSRSASSPGPRCCRCRSPSGCSPSPCSCSSAWRW